MAAACPQRLRGNEGVRIKQDSGRVSTTICSGGLLPMPFPKAPAYGRWGDPHPPGHLRLAQALIEQASEGFHTFVREVTAVTPALKPGRPRLGLLRLAAPRCWRPLVGSLTFGGCHGGLVSLAAGLFWFDCLLASLCSGLDRLWHHPGEHGLLHLGHGRHHRGL